LQLTAAEPGFSGGAPHAIALLFLGLAFFAAIAALSHEHDRAFSASLIYLGLGVGAATVIDLLDVNWVHPIDDADLLEVVSELAVIIALFGTGLKLDRPLGLRSWSIVWRLLGLAMPLTIAAIALFGVGVMGLPLGVALILGATLAPTDPVLAGDVGVGPPGEEDEREPNFSLTGEAGLNDGLAFPFLLLGVYVATRDGTGWLAEWATADVIYGVAVGLAIGALGGYAIAAGAVWLRDRNLFSGDFDAWLAVPAVLTVYGLTELVGGYGFLASFAGGVAFRRYERTHEHNRRVHDGAEVVEKFGELAVILLLGSMLSWDGLRAPGLSGWLLVPLLLVVIRPAAVMLALLGSERKWKERAFVAWFGVRGIGSVYYAAVAVGTGALASDATVVVWTALSCVVVSVFVHGVTAAPVSRRVVPER
jgi:NhaP-type Na+/H+ or K+/H+ antiporter